jgi:hypothetical protein
VSREQNVEENNYLKLNMANNIGTNNLEIPASIVGVPIKIRNDHLRTIG